jgi:hypothetical protein
MQWLLRVVCIGYFVFLTLLLLTADPARVMGVHGDLPWALQTLLPAAHALSFLVLAVLALAPRWPVPRWGIVLILASYGGMTEITQSSVPHRTPEWMDWFQDLGGIVAGAACYWTAATLCGMCVRPRRDQERLPSDPSDDWEALQKVVLHPTRGEES